MSGYETTRVKCLELALQIAAACGMTNDEDYVFNLSEKIYNHIVGV